MEFPFPWDWELLEDMLKKREVLIVDNWDGLLCARIFHEGRYQNPTGQNQWSQIIQYTASRQFSRCVLCTNYVKQYSIHSEGEKNQSI